MKRLVYRRYISVYLSICLSVYLSICLSVFWSICLSVYPSVCLSVCLSVCCSSLLLILHFIVYIYIPHVASYIVNILFLVLPTLFVFVHTTSISAFSLVPMPYRNIFKNLNKRSFF